MAEVYAARIAGEGGFEKIVAIKRMLPALAEDERFVAMFLDEARVAAHIASPNVVQTLDLGRAEDDSLYLVMELVVGVSLRHLLAELEKKNLRMPQDIAVGILLQAAQGLHDAHCATTPLGEDLQLIHRDVSPQNILLDRQGHVRITDFGVAKALHRGSQTAVGELKGTMNYLAPEQANEDPLDQRVDVFTLGAVAWETVVGRRLFDGSHLLHLFRQITTEAIIDPRIERPELGEPLARGILKALERDPSLRYPSAAAFGDALQAAIPRIASRREIGAFVQEHGGVPLAKLQSRLRRSLVGEEFPSSEAPKAVSVPVPFLELEQDAHQEAQQSTGTRRRPSSGAGQPKPEAGAFGTTVSAEREDQTPAERPTGKTPVPGTLADELPGTPESTQPGSTQPAPQMQRPEALPEAAFPRDPQLVLGHRRRTPTGNTRMPKSPGFALSPSLLVILLLATAVGAAIALLLPN